MVLSRLEEHSLVAIADLLLTAALRSELILSRRLQANVESRLAAVEFAVALVKIIQTHLDEAVEVTMAF